MSKTPRTDAEAYDVGGIQHADGCVAPARLCRELERENAKLKAYIAALEEQCDSLGLQRAQFIAKP